MVSGIWKMLWQNAGICHAQFFIFQCFSFATLGTGGSSRLTFTRAFLKLFRQTIVADFAVHLHEKRQEIAADGTPFLHRHADYASEFRVFVRQAAVGVPHCHKQEHVCSYLFRAEVQRVADEIGNIKLHEWSLAHAAPLSRSVALR